MNALVIVDVIGCDLRCRDDWHAMNDNKMDNIIVIFCNDK